MQPAIIISLVSVLLQNFSLHTMPSLGLQVSGLLSTGLLLTSIPTAMCSKSSDEDKVVLAIQDILGETSDVYEAYPRLLEVCERHGNWDLLEKILLEKREEWSGSYGQLLSDALISGNIGLIKIFLDHDLAELDILSILPKDQRRLPPFKVIELLTSYPDVEFPCDLLYRAGAVGHIQLVELLLKDKRLSPYTVRSFMNFLVVLNKVEVARLVMADERAICKPANFETALKCRFADMTKLISSHILLDEMSEYEGIVAQHLKEAKDDENDLEFFKEVGKAMDSNMIKAFFIIKDGENDFSSVDPKNFTAEHLDILIEKCKTKEQVRGLIPLQNAIIGRLVSFGPEHQIWQILALAHRDGFKTVALEKLAKTYSNMVAHRVHSCITNNPVELQYEILKNL